MNSCMINADLVFSWVAISNTVETILHSKFESNGQQKYLIRWMGDFKDSWQPIGNVTSDIIDDFNKRKIQEMANKHLAKV